MSAEPAPTRAERSGDPDRVKAFTDGVLAIIITILVLEIAVPDNLGEQSLRNALGDTGPTLLAWVISFLITGMYWVWHRDLFAQIRVVNRDVVWLNLLFLLPAALIPFAASVLGEYHDEPTALHVYGAVLIAVNIMRMLLYRYVMRRPGLLWEEPTDRHRRLGMILAAAPLAGCSADRLVFRGQAAAVDAESSSWYSLTSSSSWSCLGKKKKTMAAPRMMAAMPAT